MISFLLGFSICLNVVFILFFVLFNKQENEEIEIDKKIKKKGVKLYGKSKKFSKEEFENIDHDFYDNDL